MLKTEQWFEHWFDSPYYHLLYGHRDEKEAGSFIDVLLDYLQPAPGSLILDLACGRGRHAVYLNRRGFEVVGLDLSPRNIAMAKMNEKEGLRFYVHDMREPWPHHRFDLALNLFTSIGYFDNRADNLRAINAVAGSLVKGGLFLIDFLNPRNAIDRLVPAEEKEIDGIRFSIRRFLDSEGYIVKDMRVIAEGGTHHFQERVMLLGQDDFERYFEDAGLLVLQCFGDYRLGPYIPPDSDRMIFLVLNTLSR